MKYCCYDFEMELKSGLFKWLNGSWNVKRVTGNWRRIYFCPMCGERLKKIATTKGVE